MEKGGGFRDEIIPGPAASGYAFIYAKSLQNGYRSKYCNGGYDTAKHIGQSARCRCFSQVVGGGAVVGSVRVGVAAWEAVAAGERVCVYLYQFLLVMLSKGKGASRQKMTWLTKDIIVQT